MFGVSIDWKIFNENLLNKKGNTPKNLNIEENNRKIEPKRKKWKNPCKPEKSI